MENFNELKSKIDTFYKTHDFRGLNAFLDERAAQPQPAPEEKSPAYLYIMNEAGAFYRESGQFEKSKKAFETLMDYMEGAGMAETIEYATVVNNLAGTNRMMGNQDAALELFFKCIDIYRLIERDDSFEYASALNNIALCYLVQRKYSEAEKYQLRALEHPATGTGLTRAVSMSNLANIYAASGNIDKAVDTITAAHEFLDRVEDKGTSRYVSVIHTEASLLLAQGNYEKSCSLFQEVLNVMEIASPMSQDYSAVCKTAASAFFAAGDKERAAQLIGTATEVDTRIFGENSEIVKRDKEIAGKYRA